MVTRAGHTDGSMACSLPRHTTSERLGPSAGPKSHRCQECSADGYLRYWSRQSHEQQCRMADRAIDLYPSEIVVVPTGSPGRLWHTSNCAAETRSWKPPQTRLRQCASHLMPRAAAALELKLDA